MLRVKDFDGRYFTIPDSQSEPGVPDKAALGASILARHEPDPVYTVTQ